MSEIFFKFPFFFKFFYPLVLFSFFIPLLFKEYVPINRSLVHVLNKGFGSKLPCILIRLIFQNTLFSSPSNLIYLKCDKFFICQFRIFGLQFAHIINNFFFLVFHYIFFSFFLYYLFYEFVVCCFRSFWSCWHHPWVIYLVYQILKFLFCRIFLNFVLFLSFFFFFFSLFPL